MDLSVSKAINSVSLMKNVKCLYLVLLGTPRVSRMIEKQRAEGIGSTI